MKKYNLKSSFLHKLNLLLTFHFEENERNSIINDYEDFFTNEILHGKSEMEICSSLESPKKIVKDLCRETEYAGHLALLKNTSVKTLIFFIFSITLEILFLNLCKEYSFRYLYFALLNKLLYLGFGIGIFHRNRSSQLKYIGHAAIAGAAIIVFLLDSVAISLGYANYGRLYESILWLVLLGSCLTACYFILKIDKDNSNYFSIIFHLSGLISVCVYSINELGLLYDGKPEIIRGRIESILIYAATVLFCMVFRKIKGH